MAVLAPVLVRARALINKRWPKRDKRSDGWIGDAAHQARASDHNPNARGRVDAIDIDKDGVHAPTIIAAAIRHPSTEYVIHKGRIYRRMDRFRPRVYTGSNRHDGHIHVSCTQTDFAETSTASWNVLVTRPKWPNMWRGAGGRSVAELQAYLNAHGASLVVDGNFGAATDQAVRNFQRSRGIRVDGRVGTVTCGKLLP